MLKLVSFVFIFTKNFSFYQFWNMVILNVKKCKTLITFNIFIPHTRQFYERIAANF